MRYCYQALLDVFSEAEEEMVKEGRPTYGFGYAKEAVRVLISHCFCNFNFLILILGPDISFSV